MYRRVLQLIHWRGPCSREWNESRRSKRTLPTGTQTGIYWLRAYGCAFVLCARNCACYATMIFVQSLHVPKKTQYHFLLRMCTNAYRYQAIWSQPCQMAQLVKRRTRSPRVLSSIPTMDHVHHCQWFFIDHSAWRIYIDLRVALSIAESTVSYSGRFEVLLEHCIARLVLLICGGVTPIRKWLWIPAQQVSACADDSFSSMLGGGSPWLETDRTNRPSDRRDA